MLQVQEDYLKLINEQGRLVNVKVADLGKKIPKPARKSTLNCRDSQGNTLSLSAMVKVVDGPNKGMIGPIKHGYKNYLFLWNKEFVQSNGIFVENCRHVYILGAQFMKGSTGQAIGSQNRFVRDKLVGKMVVIVSGQFKGHRGRVTYADDKQATVEMSSQCKKIPIDKALVKLIEGEENAGSNQQDGQGGGRSNHMGGGVSMYAGGQTIYDGAKTPMNKYTPM